MYRTKAKTNGNDDYIVKYDRERIVGVLEEKAQKRLGMSAKQMLKKYRSGKLEDYGRVADLIMLSDALPKNDPLFE